MSESNNNMEKNNDESLFSIMDFFKKLKRFFPIWAAFVVLAAVISAGYAAIVTHTNQPELKALISFSYDGIEQGLDPNGRKFDVNTVKSPAVIEMALTELNIDMSNLENVRSAISFNKIIPQDAYDKFTIYNSILEKGSGNVLEAGERILETSYFPTQFTVIYNQNATALSDSQDVDLFNKILEKYDDYFYKTYGFNESFGNAVLAISYEDYDYAEAVDVFENSISTLKNYVKKLADEDETRFRSSVTGYTLDDLYASIDTVQSIDLDKVSSYIAVNNITKNKNDSIAYYEYRIKELNRLKAQYEEQIEAYDNSIKTYEKDQLLVLGNSEENNMQTNISSEEYDNMFNQKNSISEELASTKQQITYYSERLSSLKNSGKSSPANIEKVDKDLAALNVKVNDLINLVCDTSEDYYKNVSFCNAYNILVPASNTSASKMSLIIENLKMPLIIFEGIGLVIYFAAAYILTIMPDKRKK